MYVCCQVGRSVDSVPRRGLPRIFGGIPNTFGYFVVRWRPRGHWNVSDQTTRMWVTWHFSGNKYRNKYTSSYSTARLKAGSIWRWLILHQLSIGICLRETKPHLPFSPPCVCVEGRPRPNQCHVTNHQYIYIICIMLHHNYWDATMSDVTKAVLITSGLLHHLYCN